MRGCVGCVVAVEVDGLSSFYHLVKSNLDFYEIIRINEIDAMANYRDSL